MKNHLFLKLQGAQKQKLILTQKMRQAFHVLALPILELKEYVNEEIEQNPLYEKKDSFNEKFLSFNEYHSRNNEEIFNKIAQKKSLFDHLMFQAREIFNTKEELLIAEVIFSNLNPKGFLELPISELGESLKIKEGKILSVLEKVQTFEPQGICARNLQECFLIQLKEKSKEKSLAYELINNHFQDFLNNRKNLLLKNLKISKEALQIIFDDIKSLKINPSSDFYDEKAPLLIPDIRIKFEKFKWKVLINEKEIPDFSINEKISNICIQREEKKFAQSNILKGKWLKDAIENRRKILGRITFFLIKKQKEFFLGIGGLRPLNLKSVANELNMHVSSISRAVANKYIECPVGIFPLKYFFSYSINSTDISNKTGIDFLKKIIEEEDKGRPLSDDALCRELANRGINIARRTISKYRRKLVIASAKDRKKY
jgi:RNA polymerase sigma-54 factor